MTYDIQKVINIAKAEIGYLEKKSNSKLDDKTANAGTANYTKYWRDLASGMQGQPWCNCFVNWCFLKAYGEAAAKNCFVQMADGVIIHQLQQDTLKLKDNGIHLNLK